MGAETFTQSASTKFNFISIESMHKHLPFGQPKTGCTTLNG